MKSNRSSVAPVSSRLDRKSHFDLDSQVASSARERSFRSAVVGLSSLLAILLIAFGTVVAVSQPDATTPAFAEPSASVFQPLLDSSSSEKLIGETNANPDGDITVDGTLAATFPATIDGVAPEPTPAQHVHDDARYLAAFLALGRYEGLPGAQELYEPMLAELGIDFTAYDDIVAEVEAVTAALNAAPDTWHRYADATIAAALLPA